MSCAGDDRDRKRGRVCVCERDRDRGHGRVSARRAVATAFIINWIAITQLQSKIIIHGFRQFEAQPNPFLARLKLEVELLAVRCKVLPFPFLPVAFLFSASFSFFYYFVHCIGRRWGDAAENYKSALWHEDASERGGAVAETGGQGSVAGLLGLLLKTWIYRRRHKYKRSHRSRNERPAKDTRNTEKCEPKEAEHAQCP